MSAYEVKHFPYHRALDHLRPGMGGSTLNVAEVGAGGGWSLKHRDEFT